MSLILLILLWKMYFVPKNKEKILKDVVEKGNFVILDNITVTDYILYHKRKGGYYCIGFLIKIAGEQYKIRNFSGYTNYNKNNNKLEYNKAMLVKVNVTSVFF